VHPHGPQLKAYLRGKFPSVRDVDDVVQESYLRVWKRQAVQPIQSAKSFLFMVAQRIAVDLLRRNRSSPIDPLGSFAASSVLDEAPNAAEALSSREKLDMLLDAMAALPARCYQVLVLHKIEGLSQREVADRLGISERTVQCHTLTAIQRCEDHLRRRGVTRLND
jgi:RNA polymerase sigma-70 factor (ECF subfamily)